MMRTEFLTGALRLFHWPTKLRVYSVIDMLNACTADAWLNLCCESLSHMATRYTQIAWRAEAKTAVSPR